MNYAIPYLTSLTLFTAVDLIWLGLVAKGVYRGQLGTLMAGQINVWAAGVFYVVYAVGLVVFAISPALPTGSWIDAAGRGALLGFVAYAAYDLTNLATLRGWPLSLTIVDLTWGTVLSGFVAACTVWVVPSV